MAKKEYLYECDDQDRMIGPLDRAFVHLPPYPIHRATGILTITPDQKIVWQRRARFKDVFPGLLDIHGGNVKYKHEPTEQGRSILYTKSAQEEFAEEVGLAIGEDHFQRILPTYGDYFKVRLPNQNNENKAIYLVRLTFECMQELHNKNIWLKKFWHKIYAKVAFHKKITISTLCRHAIQKDGAKLRHALVQELGRTVGMDRIEFYEVEEYITMSLSEALEYYHQNPNAFADGFYSLFDPERNQAAEAKDYPGIIQQAISTVKSECL